MDRVCCVSRMFLLLCFMLVKRRALGFVGRGVVLRLVFFGVFIVG